MFSSLIKGSIKLLSTIVTVKAYGNYSYSSPSSKSSYSSSYSSSYGSRGAVPQMQSPYQPYGYGYPQGPWGSPYGFPAASPSQDTRGQVAPAAGSPDAAVAPTTPYLNTGN